jgi:hypothetical protein
MGIAAVQPLVPASGLGLDTPAGLGEAMKQQQSREGAPLWVWLAFVLIGLGIGAYVTGYWMIEEMIAHIRK